MWNPRVGGEKYYTFFSALQADPSDSANDTKTAPISCYGNRGGFILLMKFYVYSLTLSRNRLRGFLIAAWASAKIQGIWEEW